MVLTVFVFLQENLHFLLDLFKVDLFSRCSLEAPPTCDVITRTGTFSSLAFSDPRPEPDNSGVRTFGSLQLQSQLLPRPRLLRQPLLQLLLLLQELADLLVVAEGLSHQLRLGNPSVFQLEGRGESVRPVLWETLMSANDSR